MQLQRPVIAFVLSLICAAPLAAQPAPLRASGYPAGVTAPLFIVPASAVNGGGSLSTACLTFPSGTTWCETAAGALAVSGTSAQIQFGGSTASFPELKRNATGLELKLADGSAFAPFTGSVVTATTVYQLGSNGTLLFTATAPTISSGFGSSPSVASNNGTAAFTINVGTGGTAQTGVIGLPTAATGWRVNCDDVTTKSSTVYLTKQTATATTSATIGLFDAAGAAAAWTASDILVCDATAY